MMKFKSIRCLFRKFFVAKFGANIYWATFTTLFMFYGVFLFVSFCLKEEEEKNADIQSFLVNFGRICVR